MRRILIPAIVLCTATPGLAFDLAGFLATMSMGKPATVEQPPPPADRRASARTKTEAEDEPVLDPDALWMIGVFR